MPAATAWCSSPSWADWLRRARVTNVDPTRGPRFSHADHALEAALDGVGIVLGRLTLSMRDIASGRLVAPFDLMVPAQAGFYFCCLPERLDEPKIRAFRDFLFSEIAAERGILDNFRQAKRSA